MRSTLKEYLEECAAAEELRKETPPAGAGDQSRAARQRWNRKVKKKAAEMRAAGEEQ